jgi:hypothetical protein
MFTTIAFILGFAAGWYVNEKVENFGEKVKNFGEKINPLNWFKKEK